MYCLHIFSVLHKYFSCSLRIGISSSLRVQKLNEPDDSGENWDWTQYLKICPQVPSQPQVQIDASAQTLRQRDCFSCHQAWRCLASPEASDKYRNATLLVCPAKPLVQRLRYTLHPYNSCFKILSVRTLRSFVPAAGFSGNLQSVPSKRWKVRPGRAVNP